jgi:hypothetical protein
MLPTAQALVDFDVLRELPPGERYRQLSLLLMIAESTGPEMIENMAPDQPEESGVRMGLEDYPSPLARIVDPQSMLNGAAQMFRFADQNRDQIESDLSEIEQNNPILVSMIDKDELAEDAIIIRSAIADSFQYSTTPATDNKTTLLQAYQNETLHQRNILEFNRFVRKLDAVTDGAVEDLSHKLDAYQRMADDEIDSELVRQRIEAAENMNQEARDRYREQGYIRANTLYLMLIPAVVSVVVD